MLFYIDSVTGTWGQLDDLIVVDTDSRRITQDNHNWANESNEVAVVNYLDSSSDQEVKDFANIYGRFMNTFLTKHWRRGYKAAIDDVAGA